MRQVESVGCIIGRKGERKRAESRAEQSKRRRKEKKDESLDIKVLVRGVNVLVA